MSAEWPDHPEPHEIILERQRAGLTQTQAASLIYCSLGAWQKWEAGTRDMHPALWEYWHIRAGIKQ